MSGSDAYRDELQAAQRRIASLERELAVRHAAPREAPRLPRLDSDEILDTQLARRPRPALRNRVVQLALGVAAIAGLLYRQPSSWPWFMLLAAGAAFLVLVTPRLVRAYTARRLEAIETGLIAMKDAKMPAHAALLHARALLERETALLQRGQRLWPYPTPVTRSC